VAGTPLDGKRAFVKILILIAVTFASYWLSGETRLSAQARAEIFDANGNRVMSVGRHYAPEVE